MKKLLTAIIAITLCFPMFSQNASQWRGENRDGYYNETALLKQWPENGPKLLWHFDELGVGHASATVTEDGIFTAGTIEDQGLIFAFNLDGSLKWKKEYGEEWVQNWDGVRSSPVFNENKLYQLSSFGKLFCWNADNGEEIWTIDITKDYDGLNIQWGFTENLLIQNEKLFVTVGGADANVIALNKNTGSLIWKSKGLGEKSAYCSPVIITHNNHKLLLTHTAEHLIALNPENGELQWSFEHINKWAVHPNAIIYQDGKLLLVSGYGKGCVQLSLSDDAKTVSKVWEHTELDNQMGGVILLDGNLYGGGHSSRKWFVLDWETGDEVLVTADLKRGNTIFADDLLYFYDERGFVSLVKPAGPNTEVISKFDVPYGDDQHWAHLVISNKKLYVRHGTSLMVYDISL